MRSILVCPSCAGELPPIEKAPLAFACPRRAERPDFDHVLWRRLDEVAPIELDPKEKNPFLRFRALDHVYLSARAAGLSDEQYVTIVRRLDDAIARVAGHGFVETPIVERQVLQAQLFFKDETNNVSGCHKGRHLFPILVHLEVLAALGLGSPHAELVIASCGNAALAASVLARAANRPLRVFIPEDAEPSVVRQIASFGASVEVCPRIPGSAGDPTYLAFQAAVRAGSIPFSCQGGDQALAVQGGKSLAWEFAYSDAGRPDRLFVQVGGGVLASSLFAGLEEAISLGQMAALPKLHPVQTEGAFPLVRAYRRLVTALEHAHSLPALDDDEARAMRLRQILGRAGILAALQRAAQKRSEYMWPWEATPHSLAHGILDDETYDWLGVLRGTLLSGGYPILISETDVVRGYEAARAETGVDVCPTGAAAFSGFLALCKDRPAFRGERIWVPLTGKRRSETSESP